MTKTIFRIGMSMLGAAAAVAALGLWWADGAWPNGAMPTDGMVKAVALAGGGLACLFAAARLDRRKGRQSGSQA